jgi:hypothetical protein
VPIVMKSGSLNLLEPSGPVKAFNGITLPLSLATSQIGLHGGSCYSSLPLFVVHAFYFSISQLMLHFLLIEFKASTGKTLRKRNMYVYFLHL